MKTSRANGFAIPVAALIVVVSGCSRQSTAPTPPGQGVIIQPEDTATPQERLTATIKSAPKKVMNQPGLVGAQGGAYVKLFKTGTFELLLPLPQLADGQAPVCYYISSTPGDAMIEHRLRKRESDNVVVSVRLRGDANQEVQIDWCAAILVAGKAVAPNVTTPKDYMSATACVQSEAKEITKLAADLWPKSGKVADYARNIQRYVRDMKEVKRPQSLDALGILNSGANGICTANANLAAALLRSKEIACRSLAVIPPIGQRLEMHRIVEFFEDGQWLAFDPSSVHTDVPMKPWQYIIMAKTTPADENIAMKPRMGSMLGCPYAQELEVIGDGIAPWGQDFFWTTAKPIADFDVDDQAITRAADAWNRYLETGILSQGQIKAATTKNAKEFLEFLQSK